MSVFGIYVGYFFSHGLPALMGLGLLCEVLQSHSVTPHSVGLIRTGDKPITTHNVHERQTSKPPTGFIYSIPASMHPQTHTLDCTVTGIGCFGD